ncbi:MAG TPA: hypothetical protein P5154_02605 [Candidatus Izemoplasmatales bacterium]|nr:hypothetical protein [Bacillota bacterium]HRY77636.1 hypothetical protein [Candidatus Izemoplasmatales bacterium]
MEIRPQPQTFIRNEKRFLRVTGIMTLVSMVLMGLSMLAVYTVTPAPAFVIVFVSYYLYYHVAPFLFGIFRIGKFITGFHSKYPETTIRRSVLSMLLTPISAGFVYVAFIFFALSSCAQ